jgi:hypothetical protein
VPEMALLFLSCIQESFGLAHFGELFSLAEKNPTVFGVLQNFRF